MSQQRDYVLLLAASAGLGTYVPAVLLSKSLNERDIQSEIIVLEQFFSEVRIQRFIQGRERCTHDFDFALLTQRFVQHSNILADIEIGLLHRSFLRWVALKVTRFIVFSGFWLPILELFISITKHEIHIECVQMDSVLSHSWRHHLPSFTFPTSLQWLFSHDREAIEMFLVPPCPRKHLSSKLLLVHGGGWQLGDYRTHATHLTKAGYRVTLGVPSYLGYDATADCVYSTDPDWEPWIGEHLEFPPIVWNSGKGWRKANGHWLRSRVSKASALVCKPGGGTLLDSITYGVPVVFCAPFGGVEEANCALWRRLGFGVNLVDWEKTNYSFSVLEELAKNIRARQAMNHPNFIDVMMTT